MIFGLAFITLVSPGPPAPPVEGEVAVSAMLIAGGLLASALAALVPGRAVKEVSRAKSPLRLIAFGLAANLATLAALSCLAIWQLGDPRAHAQHAVRAALLGYVALQIFIAAVFAAFALDQARRGELAAGPLGALRNWNLWQSYTLAVAAISAAVIWAQGLSQ